MAQPTRGVGTSARSRGRTPTGTGHGTGSASRGRTGVDRRARAADGTPVTDDTASAVNLGKGALAALRAHLAALIEPVVAREGLDLEEVTVTRAGRRLLVRVTVDADGGVGHDELSDASRAVSDALDEAEEQAGELTPGSYTLELSSPGVDRPLTQPRHWHRNVGRLIAVKVAGRAVTGRVVATDARGVSLDVDGRRLDAAFDELGPGRVQVEFTRLAELADEDFGDVYEPNIELSGDVYEPNIELSGDVVEPTTEVSGPEISGLSGTDGRTEA